MKTSRLSSRLRKFIGLWLILAFLTLYALIIMALAISTRVPQSGLSAFAFYLVAGLAWIVPLAPIISWMQRPYAPKD